MKKIPLFVLGLLLAFPVSALQPPPGLNLSRYAQKVDFKVKGIVTPKVVRFESKESLQGQTVLVKSGTQNPLSHEVNRSWDRITEKIPVEVTGFSSLFEGSTANITDGNYDTFFTFDGRKGNHYMVFRFPEVTEVSSFFVTLGKGVLPPKKVSIEGTFESGETNYIVKDLPYRPFISWPPVKVTELKFELDSPHLLRISEVDFGGTEISKMRDELLFFAEEGVSYTLYFDTSFGAKTYRATEYNPVRSDAKTPTFNLPWSEENPGYDNDFDDDGVEDFLDLCPKIADGENKDIDSNGRGDVCEDPDQDGIPSYKDNCTYHYNPDQSDEDQDGLGDKCDGEESRMTENAEWLVPTVFGLVIVVLLGLVWRSLKKG